MACYYNGYNFVFAYFKVDECCFNGLLRQDLCPCQTSFPLFMHFEWVYQVSLLDKVINPSIFFLFLHVIFTCIIQYFVNAPFQENLSYDEKQSEQMVRSIVNKNWLKDELIIAPKLYIYIYIIHDTVKLKFANQKKRPKTMVWKMKRTKPKMNPLQQYILLMNA